MNKNKGFTIIELIVVIAIIAILAAIVLISISGYIKKGQDASLKETMHTVQTDVVSAATTGSGLVFPADPCSTVSAWTTGVLGIQKGTTTVGGVTLSLARCASNNGVAGSANDKFCACVQELADTTKFICVDSGKQVETGTDCLARCTANSTVTGAFTCP